MGTTLYKKIWERHVVTVEPDGPTVLYVDLHLLAEPTSRVAFTTLRERGMEVRRPELTVASADHCVPTIPALRHQPVTTMLPVVSALLKACAEFGIEVFGPHHLNQGIVHVIGPELGLTQPGMTVVCGDSHTPTHGALGALAFGVGTTQVGHVLATQTLLQRPSKAMRVRINGQLPFGTTSKDVALLLLSRHGVAFAAGHAIEYCGAAVEAMTIEQRMTLCNMSSEMGARSGFIAPDDKTFEYLAGRAHAPSGGDWDEALADWRSLRSDDDAVFDAEIELDAGALAPMVTFGTTPAMAVAVDDAIPSPETAPPGAIAASVPAALSYMGLASGIPIAGTAIDTVFIGSCTNSRIEDLRAAASILEGRSVATGTRLLVVPGSQQVKKQAEEEGLDQVFLAAGGEWREAGCSMCVAGNGDVALPGTYIASTTNRNFQGRQGQGARTLLMSPLTAAATAIEGVVADPRRYLRTPAGVA